jgi:hypothetical protein
MNASASASPLSGVIQIELVHTAKQLREFVSFPFALYKNDPYWVPPFIEERLDFLNKAKNPFFDNAHSELFLARRQGHIVGTIGGAVNIQYNMLNQAKLATFGFFECIDDDAVAAALFAAVEQWARDLGMHELHGPMSFTTNHEIGLLIDGFETAPMLMLTHNPRYYARLIAQNGFSKAIDMYAYIGDLEERLTNAPPKVVRVAEAAMQRKGIRVRSVNKRDFKAEVQRFLQVYQEAWSGNWGFVPLSKQEAQYLGKQLRWLIDPDLAFIAETTDGKPIAVSISLPDINQAMRISGGGNMWPFGLIKTWRARKQIDQARLWTMGVVKEYRHLGIDAVFYLQTAKAALAKGYKRLEGSLILENNTMMNRIIDRLGGERYKTYRIYRKPLLSEQDPDQLSVRA